MVYGLLASMHNHIWSSGSPLPRAVAARGRMVMKNIINEFGGHIVYLDTDSVIFNHYDEIKDRLERYLARYPHLTYTTNKAAGTFMAKKKYILHYPDGTITVKGLKRR